jgi:hypothetical protein
VDIRGQQETSGERRLVAAIAAYVVLLHALIVGFVPIPTSAQFDLAASTYDICHHKGQPQHAPAGHDNNWPLVSFYNACCAIGATGLAPSIAAAGLHPTVGSTIIAADLSDDLVSHGATLLAAAPRGPPLPA